MGGRNAGGEGREGVEIEKVRRAQRSTASHIH